MQNNKFIDDFTKVMTSAVNAAFDMRHQFEDTMRRNTERYLEGMGFVPREEFDVVKEMASKARRENEALKHEIEKLERELSHASRPAAPAPRKPHVAAAAKAPVKKISGRKSTRS